MRWIVALLFVCACALAPSRPPEPELDPITLGQLAFDATVRISTATGNGSGFAVADSLIATAAHVAEQGMKIETSDGQACDVGEWVVSGTADVALIRVFGCTLRPLVVRSRPLERGERVYASGNPLGLPYVLTSGIVSIPDWAGRVVVDAAINPGMSGGPLLDACGQAVGINVAIFTRDGLFAGIGLVEPISRLTFAEHLFRLERRETSSFASEDPRRLSERDSAVSVGWVSLSPVFRSERGREDPLPLERRSDHDPLGARECCRQVCRSVDDDGIGQLHARPR